MIQATLGAMSTLEDVEKLVGFLETQIVGAAQETYRRLICYIKMLVDMLKGVVRAAISSILISHTWGLQSR